MSSTGSPYDPIVMDFSALPEADQQAVGDTLFTLLKGFRSRDAEALVGVYSHDADWVNVFGTVKNGADEIIGHLRVLFQNETFLQRELAGPPDTIIRVVTPEVVIVLAHVIVRDKADLSGRLDKDNFSLRVLQRQGDGSWLVISEIFQDAADISAGANSLRS